MMTEHETKQLEVRSRRNKGPDGAHPDAYLRAGSVFTFNDVEFAVPPLYPSSATTVEPVFTDDGELDLSMDVDKGIVDDGLVALAEAVRTLAPVDDGEVCPECGTPKSAVLSVDPGRDVEFLKAVCQYARGCLLRMYDLTAEDLNTLLRFTGDTLPAWVVQALTHSLSLPAEGGAS